MKKNNNLLYLRSDTKILVSEESYRANMALIKILYKMKVINSVAALNFTRSYTLFLVN